MKKNADKNIKDLTSEDIKLFLTPRKTDKEKTLDDLPDDEIAKAIQSLLHKDKE